MWLNFSGTNFEGDQNKLTKKLKNQINDMENGLEKSKNVTKIVVD